NRHTGETNMNERSSRSHTIFRMIIESRMRVDEDVDEAVNVSQLNLVDLAGSERAGQTGATGDRFREGIHINKSLLMLGHVISRLSEGSEGQFVNYRDSKLTRILQNSLGGNARTAIICTVTPASVEQTHSTLKFASRAKCIKNKPVVNEVMTDAAILKRYAKLMQKMTRELEDAKQYNRVYEVEAMEKQLEEKDRQMRELEIKIKQLKEKFVVSSHASQGPSKGHSTYGFVMLTYIVACLISSVMLRMGLLS
ncbi:centromere-associated protein E-like, partial [Limulus polyphemus]|uniref:Kinesin-like protein n=1 Tax=Limulus polyphemus TaxID=6850 RepID=A0ABM1RUV2_LIMPO